MFPLRTFARVLILALSFSCLSFELAHAATATEVQSSYLARAMLSPLLGHFKVEKTSLIGGVRYGQQLTTHREYIDNSMYLNESTSGLMADRDYLRMGSLGFNTKTNQYEWTTFDSLDSSVNEFVGQPSSKTHGEFRLNGIASSRKTWTRIKIESRNRHIFEVYVENKNGKDVLIDRMVFTRTR